jgi:alpha-1,3-mannosyltransferase
LFVEEESGEVEFAPGPEYGERSPPLLSTLNSADPFTLTSVWCWGWDGAGDLDGPDVDPIWERVPNKSLSPDAVKVKHKRGLRNFPRGL